MQAFTIRPFRPSDAEALLALHTAAIFATSDAFHTEAQRKSWAHGLKAEGYVRIARDEETYFVAADAEDRPLGFCSFADAEVMGLYVHPDHQTKGIGTTLLQAAESALRKQGADVVAIVASLPALAFYRSHGYELTEMSTVRTRGGEILETAHLRKRLRD